MKRTSDHKIKHPGQENLSGESEIDEKIPDEK